MVEQQIYQDNMADKKQINPRRPIPSSGYDRLRDNISANIQVPGAPPPGS